ncbi:MAG TPA: phosphatidylglycerol lysyltransferase domain-containing protein [Solirubrobacteraceae bacterium]|nr:phosphatidylglycerol lysyltransferase domain-containing protein [Solirubrobacteraceae bacterium]
MSAQRRWRLPAAVATALAGVLTLSSSLSPTLPARQRLLEALEPGSAEAAAHAAGVIGGVVLLGLSLGLLRGRRRAGPVAIGVLCVLAAVHTVKGLDYEEALLALALAGLLWAGRRALARGAAPSRPLVAGLYLLLALTGAYAATVTALLVSGHPPGVGDALVRAGRAVVDGGSVAGLGQPLKTIVHALIGIVAVALFGVLRALLAPARAQDGHDASEHALAARIVAEHGEDSIAPFVLRADKAFHFSRGGVLAYRTLRETAVVSGDPVGPPGSAAGILADFLEVARERGWDVVLTGAAERHLEAYRALGLRTLRIGSEAIADPATFTLAGRAGRTVRKAVHRVEKHGWTIEVRSARELTPLLAAELAKVEETWRRGQPRLYGFAMTMDRLWGAPEDLADTYVIGRRASGEVRAFQRYVTYRDGLSLDAMRRLDDEPNGISDALVAAALEHARGAGVREVSLNFAGFAHIMAADVLERRSQRLFRWVLRRMHGRFSLERLVRFNQKFQPRWEPRFLVYTQHTRLPLAALRVLQAEAYVKPPAPQPRRGAWRPRTQPLAGPGVVT